MSEYHDPTWLVQRAWSQFRLPALQHLVEVAIADLRRLEPGELLECEAYAADAHTSGNPLQEALNACIEELQDACGMADAGDRRAKHCERVRDYIAQHPSAWGEAFSAALEKYRHAASSALQNSFAAQVTPGLVKQSS
jgi:hypothetical protein